MEASFWANYQNIIGFIALCTGIVYVVLATFRLRICWIFGGISSACFVLNLWNAHFFVDALINVYYLVMAFYGWYWWQSDKAVEDIVSKNKTSFHFYSILCLFLPALLLGYILHKFTPTPYPYADAWVGILSVYATWLTAKKVAQSWFYWIAADLLAAILYFAKELYFESILMAVYAFVAVFGFYEWIRIYNKRRYA